MSYESLRNQFDSLAYDIAVKGTHLRPQERIDKLNQLRALTGTIMEQVHGADNEVQVICSLHAVIRRAYAQISAFEQRDCLLSKQHLPSPT